MTAIAPIDVVIGNNENAEVTMCLVQQEGSRVLQQMFFEPNEALEIAGELTKWAQIAKAKREGAKGAA